jgi:formate-dependent nitrite reductase membrane component NrfD
MAVQPWDFMTKDTPSREWSHGAGIFIAVAFFFGGAAGGLYLLSLYFNNLWGMFIALILACAMGLSDLVHLGNKAAAWRIAFRPGSSWISRGFLLVILFIGSAAIQLAISYWAPDTVPETLFKVVAGIAAFGVATYSGFVVSYVSSIKFWHSAVMPVLFIVAGLTGGAAILMVINSFAGGMVFTDLKNVFIAALVVYTVIIAGHFWISTYSGSTAKNSVKSIVAGESALLFWLVNVAIGIIAPIIITLFANADSQALFIVAAACVLAGNMSLRYIILRAGMYTSLLPM